MFGVLRADLNAGEVPQHHRGMCQELYGSLFVMWLANEEGVGIYDIERYFRAFRMLEPKRSLRNYVVWGDPLSWEVLADDGDREQVVTRAEAWGITQQWIFRYTVDKPNYLKLVERFTKRLNIPE